MTNYCSSCGKPVEETSAFCPHCGAKIPSSSTPPAEPHSIKNYTNESPLPPEADSIISLNHIAGIIAILFGCILLIIGIFTLIILIGIVGIIFGVIDLLIWSKIKEINSDVMQKKYRQAKSKQLTWSIIGILLGGIVIGLILLISYLKYDELIRFERQ